MKHPAFFPLYFPCTQKGSCRFDIVVSILFPKILLKDQHLPTKGRWIFEHVDSLREPSQHLVKRSEGFRPKRLRQNELRKDAARSTTISQGLLMMKSKRACLAKTVTTCWRLHILPHVLVSGHCHWIQRGHLGTQHPQYAWMLEKVPKAFTLTTELQQIACKWQNSTQVTWRVFDRQFIV